MSTRSTANKSEVDGLYKSAIENPNTSKSKTSNTLYTSTPTGPSKSTSRQINLPLNDSAIAKDQTNEFVGSPEPDFDDSGDITIQPADNFNNTISDKQLIKSKTSKIAHNNPLATLKYAVEALFRRKKYPFKLFY